MIEQFLEGIMAVSETLKHLVPTIIVILLLTIILFLSRRKIKRRQKEQKEFREWLVVEVVTIMAISALVPYKLLDFWIGYTLGLLLGIIFLAIAIFFSIYFLLAPNNCFFTFVKEGTAKYIVRGDKFERCLIQWEGYTFDYSKPHPEKWNVVKGKEPRHPFGGLRFYGIWPIFDVYIYQFSWTGVNERRETQPHDKVWLDYILLKDDVYLCMVSGAEDKDLIPLDLKIFLTIRIVNPYKAKFAVQNWLETVINRMEPSIRQYVAQYSFEELIPKKQTVGSEMWNKLKETGLIGRMEDPEGQRGEFIDRYGAEVRAIEVQDISPPEGLQKIILAKTTAEKEAAAEIARARGDKKATIIRAKGEEKRIGTVYNKIKEFKDLGKLIRTLEAMERSPLAASVTIQAIPGLPEVLRGIFGKPPEKITLKEIRELKKIIKKILKSQKKK